MGAVGFFVGAFTAPTGVGLVVSAAGAFQMINNANDCATS